MAEKHIADKEAEFVAVNGPPDLCRVGKSVIPFDITDKLDRARDPSDNVYARGHNVLTQATRVSTVAGDAGSGLTSGVSRGHSIVLRGSSTVNVNGKPCARHGDPVGMNCNGGDTYNTTGELKTLKLGPKPDSGSPAAGQQLRERLSETRQALQDNPMGKTAEEAGALQQRVQQLVADTAQHEQAAMQAVVGGGGDSAMATWGEAMQTSQGARNLVAEAQRQVLRANPTARLVGDAAASLVPGSGLVDAAADWNQARGQWSQGDWKGAAGSAAMAAFGAITEAPGLKQLKGLFKAGKAVGAGGDATRAAEAAKAAKAAKAADQAGDAKTADKAADNPGAEAGAGGSGGGKGGGGRDGVVVKGKATKVPCFHPFDKKKFNQMSPEDKKAYLKEMAEQLQRQQDGINNLTATQYKAARDAFQAVGRNPVADGAQAGYRSDFAAQVFDSIQGSLTRGGMGLGQAKTEAANRTKDLMGKLAALHDPDMVAGGWMQPGPMGMGRADVNSSIGASWNQDGRVSSMDAAADDAIRNGRGDEKMNVKLEPCRGKGKR